MKAAFFTLGCKVNQYETQAMEQLLRQRGHDIVPFDADADAYILNTCSVTADSDRKSRQFARRIRREHPQALLALCGCYTQTRPEEAQKLSADLISGTADRTGFILRLEALFTQRQRDSSAETETVSDETEKMSAGTGTTSVETEKSSEETEHYSVETGKKMFPLGGEFEVLPAGLLPGRTRAMLKVEDGCTNFCSYCVIPYARGKVRSAPPEVVVQQVLQLRENGVREIVLTGIELSSWGRDLRSGQNLTDLMEMLCDAVPDVRIRLGSLEPRTVTEEFCRRAAKLSNLCPQFHLSLQSGCDATLRRMNRKYDTARYRESVALLRRYFTRPAITTDLITGFPGETESEFTATLAFIRECGFARMHVFPYSERPGTVAAAMEQLPVRVREERARRVMEEAALMRAEYLSGCAGETYAVLFERRRGNWYLGHAPNYTEVRVYAPHGELCVNKPHSELYTDKPHSELCTDKPHGEQNTDDNVIDCEDLHNQIRNVQIDTSDGVILTGHIV